MTCFVGLDVSPASSTKLAADCGGASASPFQNRSAVWSAGMREMMHNWGSRPER